MSLELIRDLQSRLAIVDRDVLKTRGIQVGSMQIRENTREAVDSYFRIARPELIEALQVDTDIQPLDSVMQALLECAQHRTTVRRYRSVLRESIGCLARVEKLMLLKATKNLKTVALSPVDTRIVETLSRLAPSAALSYEQAHLDLSVDSRLSWRGPATDLREALRETLDQLAPDKEVSAQTGFKLEKDCVGPTMKQKVRYVLGLRGRKQNSMAAPEQAAVAVEEAVGSFVRSVYTKSNVSTHTPTDKDEVLRVRDWVRVALCELLEIRQ